MIINIKWIYNNKMVIYIWVEILRYIVNIDIDI